jgi:protein gp37
VSKALNLPKKAEKWVPRIRRHMTKSVEGIIATGREFIAAKEKLDHGEFGKLSVMLNLEPRAIQKYMAIATNEALSNTSQWTHLPASWTTLYELSRLDAPRLKMAFKNGDVTPLTERSDARNVFEKYKDIEVIAEVVEIDAGTNGSEETPEPESVTTFNRVNNNIGWARWSWNPVTGCLHNCDYCYARDIANRFYPQKFEPTFFPERLDAPANTKLPKNIGDDPAWRRVFTCSMADLFGKWVQKEWITAVFDRISDHQEWEFLCLTKFPQRLAELEWPSNVWAGTTVDRQSRVENAERSFAGVKAGVKWLSCEPLLEPLRFTSLSMFDWVVIGASTGSTLAPPFAPPFEWVVDLYSQARASGCKVYLKHNLFGSSDGREPGMQPIHEWPR